MTNNTLLHLQAQRDVLLLIEKAVTSPQLMNDRELFFLVGGISALDISIELAKGIESF